MSDRKQDPEYVAAWPCGCVFAWGIARGTAEVAEFYKDVAKAEKSSGVPVTVRELPPSGPATIAWAWHSSNPCTACPPRKKSRAKRATKAKGPK